MKRSVLFIALGAVLVMGAVTFVNYDQWFTYPSKRVFVSAKLTDPDSAQYRNERITHAGWLCGEINWKGPAGGYIGFNRFVSGSADDVYLEHLGHVGGGPTSTKRIMDRLEAKTDLLKSLNLAAKVTGQRPNVSEEEVEQLVNARIFEAQWKAQCAD